MLFSVEKCKVMYMGYNDSQYSEYFMHETRLKSVREEKDGVSVML